MVRTSSSATDPMYPILQTEVLPNVPDYAIPEEFGYGCSAQTNGPSPELGASFLVSYPYMQYTNPNNSRYNPMETMNFQDRSQIMQSINDLVVDNVKYDQTFQKKMIEDKARYMLDMAEIINKSQTMKQLSGEFKKANPMKAEETVVTTVPGKSQVVRKGGQDIIVKGAPRAVIREVDEGFERDLRSTATWEDVLSKRAVMAAFVIVLMIFIFASRDD